MRRMICSHRGTPTTSALTGCAPFTSVSLHFCFLLSPASSSTQATGHPTARSIVFPPPVHRMIVTNFTSDCIFFSPPPPPPRRRLGVRAQHRLPASWRASAPGGDGPHRDCKGAVQAARGIPGERAGGRHAHLAGTSHAGGDVFQDTLKVAGDGCHPVEELRGRAFKPTLAVI